MKNYHTVEQMCEAMRTGESESLTPRQRRTAASHLLTHAGYQCERLRSQMQSETDPEKRRALLGELGKALNAHQEWTEELVSASEGFLEVTESLEARVHELESANTKAKGEAEELSERIAGMLDGTELGAALLNATVFQERSEKAEKLVSLMEGLNGVRGVTLDESVAPLAGPQNNAYEQYAQLVIDEKEGRVPRGASNTFYRKNRKELDERLVAPAEGKGI